MTTWALIPCSKKKARHPCPAREMYWPSALFRGAVQVAEKLEARVLIFSARYGVLSLDQRIFPYNVALSGATVMERERWTADVIQLLRLTWPGDSQATIKPEDRVISFLPQAYGEILHRVLRENGITVEEPLKGMGQGQRLRWFKEWLGVVKTAQDSSQDTG